MVIVFGSINLDLIFSLPHIPRAGETVLGPATRIEPGGKGANQAVASARDGAVVVMAGAIGADALGETALALMQEAGVDLERVARLASSTGCAAIVVDQAGENAIAVGSGANLLVHAEQVEDAILQPDATLVLQMEVPPQVNAALIERASAAGMRIVLNLAPAGILPEPALRKVSVLVVNASEGGWLADHLGCEASALALHRRLGGITVVQTQGGEGADVASLEATWHEAACAVNAVDTTAAGDCFAGVLAHRLDQGGSLREAVRRASAAAALCCTRSGSQGSLPTRTETDAFLESSTRVR